MKIRSMLIVTLVLVLMLIPNIAQAQDSCFGLSAEDCGVVMTAAANGIGDATSMTLEYEFEFSIAGVPDPSMSSVLVTSEGAIDMNEGGAGVIPINMGGAVNVAFSQNDVPGFELPVEFRLVDDVFYFSDPFAGAWSGMNIAALITDPAFAESLSALPVNPMTGDMGPMADMDPAALAGLAGLLEIPDLIVYERIEDDFILSIDLTALSALNDPEFAEVQNSLVTLLEGIEPGTSAMLPMILGITNEALITFSQHVDTELNIVDSIEFTVDVEVNATAITGQPGDPITANMYLGIDVTNIGMAPKATAPDTFTEMDPMMLMGMLGG